MMTKLLEAYSIPVPPRLAGLLKQVLGRTGTGFDEGAFLQQLHYWTLNPATRGWIVDSVKWIYNSLKSWQAQFPWMTQYGLRKAIANLKKLGLIQTAQHWISQYKRVMFYRIDYEQLNALTGVVCEQLTHRSVEGDRIDVTTVHNSDPENKSDTSFPEQQTGVVLGKVGIEDTCELPEPETGPVEERHESGTRGLAPASSGNTFDVQGEVFPELLAKVARAVGLPEGDPLPRSLRRAIAQFPERVRGAIGYLKYQQQKRKIENPVGYLYEAIVAGWELAVPRATIEAVSVKQHMPVGFREWFEQARLAGLVLAATTIDGVHCTLHVEGNWVPTTDLMQQFSNSWLQKSAEAITLL